MLKNVKYHSGKCTKRIVFNSLTGLPKPVGRVDKNMKPGNQYAGTYQEIADGDIILRCIWENDRPQINAEIVGGRGMSIDAVDMTGLLLNMNPLFLKWLTNNDDNLFVPKGCGWDGVFSESDKIKYVSLQQNLPSGLPGELVDRIAKACYFTSLKEIDKDWKIQHYGLNPIVSVNKDFNVAIEVFTDGTVEITIVNEDFAYEVSKDTEKYILIRFVPLKVKGAEKIEWEIIKINH